MASSEVNPAVAPASIDPWATLLAAGAAAAMTCVASPANAQAAADGWSLSGTARLRYEAIDGQARAGANGSDDLINLRTTVLAQYRDGPVRIAAELWDSRAYGANAGTPISTGEVNAVELVQAFAEIKGDELAGAGSTAALTAGRLLLNIGSRRLIANDDFRNTTNAFTGLRADLGWRNGWKATLIYTMPQQRRPDAPSDLRHNKVAVDHEGFDLVLWGGLVSRAQAIGAATLEASYFHLEEHDTAERLTRDRSLDTVSARMILDPAPRTFDGELEAIAQHGSISTSLVNGAPRQDVRAWFVHADAGYTFGDPWKTRLSVEYDHASGDRPGGAYGRFDSLFGMRRADLAPAGLYNAIVRSNVVSPGLRIETAPDKHTDLMATVRPMWLAAREDAFSSTAVRDPTGRSGSFAGTQTDARVRHQLVSWLKLELDAVLLAKERFLRDAPNAPRGAWTKYVSINATATF